MLTDQLTTDPQAPYGLTPASQRYARMAGTPAATAQQDIARALLAERRAYYQHVLAVVQDAARPARQRLSYLRMSQDAYRCLNDTLQAAGLPWSPPRRCPPAASWRRRTSRSWPPPDPTGAAAAGGLFFFTSLLAGGARQHIMEELFKQRLLELEKRLAAARHRWNIAKAAGFPNNCESAIKVDILSALYDEMAWVCGERPSPQF